MHLQVTVPVPTDPRTAGTMLADPVYVLSPIHI